MKSPIYDFAKKYALANPLRLHMPGHKGQSELGFEQFDLTELNGADDLYASNGIIEEQNTAKNNNLKSNKISKEELKELKELIKTIEEQYEEKTLQKHEIVIDNGSTTKSIYSNEMKKWIILSSSTKIKLIEPVKLVEKLLTLCKNVENLYNPRSV